ncbi:MAG: endonuclease/exonuclease/phosphatase family protein [Planctomycetota bacterium]
MTGFARHVALLIALGLLVGCSSGETVRFATFNAAMSQESQGEMLAKLRQPGDEQFKAVAEIIQKVRPDVLVLQEFDYAANREAVTAFQANYLAEPQNGGEPISYAHVYAPTVNTGVPTGIDLNGDGTIAPSDDAPLNSDAYAGDAHGWGKFPGQYAFVVLSKYPLSRYTSDAGNSLWRDLPGNTLPDDFYSDEAKQTLRLSSKTHADVSIVTGGEDQIRLVAAHPTPPVFDGPEDRNGRRNHDEILLLYDMVSEERDGLPKHFVAMGDLNSDPFDGDHFVPVGTVDDPEGTATGRNPPGVILPAPAIQVLMGHPRVQNITPKSPGGLAAAKRDGGINEKHEGDPAADTADWGDRDPGNLRVDYVLPSRNLTVVASGVVWPADDEPLMGIALETVERASDHRMVWVDVEKP